MGKQSLGLALRDEGGGIVSRFNGQYPPDWKQRSNLACEQAGHRCIRCQHPYVKGTHGKGEWTPCDHLCRHGNKTWVDGKWMAHWRILTVHHFDGQKDDCEWYNLLPLCQRCHLQIQGKVDPNIPYFFEHSDWLKPFVAGWYAKKYLGENLTREEVAARMPELLALECRVTS